jgi:hypothetical protein
MVTMINSQDECLARFEFSFERVGAHLARSMMLDDLQRLEQRVPNASAAHEEYSRTVPENHCLGKRSSRSRAFTLRHLTSLCAGASFESLRDAGKTEKYLPSPLINLHLHGKCGTSLFYLETKHAI